jgi:hypothetical protein
MRFWRVAKLTNERRELWCDEGGSGIAFKTNSPTSSFQCFAYGAKSAVVANTTRNSRAPQVQPGVLDGQEFERHATPGDYQIVVRHSALDTRRVFVKVGQAVLAMQRPHC